MNKYILSLSMVFTLVITPFAYAEKNGFFSTIYNDVTSSGVDGAYDRKKIREWYSQNKGKLVIVDRATTLDCVIDYGSDFKCIFNAQLVNNTDYELTDLVLKIKAFNKKNDYLVTEEIISLPISIYPTVKKSISVRFTSLHVGNARAQLGKNFSWNYDLVAYIPKHLHEHKSSSWSYRNDTRYVFDWLAE
jgi:hypothetical protein